jgi:hypothetical protein
MNPINSSDFRSKNQVLFQTKILQNQKYGLTAGCGGSYTVGNFDVIDLKQNNKFDWTFNHTGGMFSSAYKGTPQEPSFKEDYDKLKAYAERYKAEVITQDDVSGLLIQDLALEGDRSHDTLIPNNTRQISTLVSELEPFEKDAKWAIDVKSNEFLVYKPKE